MKTLFFVLGLVPSFAFAAPRATQVFVGGRIVAEGGKPVSRTAIALSGDRILAVGTDAEIKKLAGPETVTHDLKGQTVIPGLIDAHVHLYSLGAEKSELDLSGAKDEAAAAEIVRAKAQSVPKGSWIVGRGWDQNRWKKTDLPTAASLDKVVGENPVVLSRIDGHAAWVNTKALKLAGITRESQDTEGGKIVRDKNGDPSGVLIDKAMSPVYRQLPSPSKTSIEEAIKLAVKEAAASGLTSVHDMSVGKEQLEVLEDLARRRELPIRVAVYMAGRDPALVNEWLASGPKQDAYDRYLSVRGFKIFADGALGSRGAALLKPYDDDPANLGVMMATKEDIVEISKKAARAGFQVATHAIGDRGNRTVLDAYQEAFASYPSASSPRFRIEHAQILSPEDIPRFAKLGVIASMQATHCTSDMPWVPARIGKKRAEDGAYSWKALLRSGAKIANGSDAPVESINPFLGLYAAMTRMDLEGKPPGGWIPKNKMSFAEALRSFTVDAAYAAFEENQKGTLEPGKLADFVVLNEKLDTLAPAKIPAVRPQMTVVGGRIVYDATKKLAEN